MHLLCCGFLYIASSWFAQNCSPRAKPSRCSCSCWTAAFPWRRPGTGCMVRSNATGFTSLKLRCSGFYLCCVKHWQWDFISWSQLQYCESCWLWLPPGVGSTLTFKCCLLVANKRAAAVSLTHSLGMATFPVDQVSVVSLSEWVDWLRRWKQMC